MGTEIAWATDIHFDHARGTIIDSFFNSVKSSLAGHNLVGLVITGDISNSSDLERHLCLISESVDIPVYFVLGNHDAYGSSIGHARDIARNVSKKKSNMFFLDGSKAYMITDKTCVVGVNGWADARTGNFMRVPDLLADYHLVADLKHINIPKLREKKLNQLGDENANRLRRSLETVPEEAEEVIIATHVPPWREACWHEGEISDDTWSPHFTCIAVGQEIERYADESGKSITVLCGHTHGEGDVKIKDNIRSLTGYAKYQNPSLCDLVKIS